MRLSVSASGVENGEVTYFSNLPPKKLPPGPEYSAVHFGVEHVQASGSFPAGFPLDNGQEPGLLGWRPD
jgi:hypothetical protein